MIAALLATIDAVAVTTLPAWAAAASVAAGSLVGLSLGLTGGAIFAVPLLVYWIGVGPRTAVSISLVTVAATALIGATELWSYGQVEVGTGRLFATAAMLIAPAGGWLAGLVPQQTLMAAFGTSLFVMTLVRAAAVAAQLPAGRSIPLDITGSFAGGGGPALFVGSWIGRSIGGPTLARAFSVAIVLVATFIIFEDLAGT